MFYTLPEDRQKTDTLLQSTVSLGKRQKKNKKVPTKLKILHIYIHTGIEGEGERKRGRGSCTESSKYQKGQKIN